MDTAKIVHRASGIAFFFFAVFFGLSPVYAQLASEGKSAVSFSSGSQASNVTGDQVRVAQEDIVQASVAQSRVPLSAKPRTLLLRTFLYDVCTRIGQGLPSEYKQTRLSRRMVEKNTPMEDALKKCVYLDILQPITKLTSLDTPVHGDFITTFLLEKFNLSLPKDIGSDTITHKLWDEEIHYRVPTYYAVKRILSLSSRGANASYESPLISSPYFDALASVFTSLQREYLYTSGSIQEEKVLYGAIDGMMKTLNDPYSVYMPPEDTTDFFNNLQGEVYGIGVYVDIINGQFTIVAPLKDSPAQHVGLQAGDRVIAVDDWIIPESFTIQDVTKRIKGPVDTSVKITIIREGKTSIYTITRKKISAPLLDVKKDTHAMIFTITSFGQGLDTDFAKALEMHKADISATKNIIIDLRNNGGGYAQVSFNLMEHFVASGSILIQSETRYGVEVIRSQATTPSVFSGKNIFILINKGTASASEQLAGVIKEYYPQTRLIGETTFGKGSMQGLLGLPNTGVVKYSVGLRYIGASKKSVQDVGLSPDNHVIDDTHTLSDEVMEYTRRILP